MRDLRHRAFDPRMRIGTLSVMTRSGDMAAEIVAVNLAFRPRAGNLSSDMRAGI